MADSDQQWQAWVQGLVEGDPQVVGQFWQRYGLRLQGLAAEYLTPRLRRREGPDDVVQSVCRTFFRRAQDGQFQLADAGDLWRLLCAITVTKVREKARYHRRGKRSIDRQQDLDFGSDSSPGELPIAAAAPTPAEAAEFADELQRLLSGMDDEQRQLVELKLEQYTNREIADKLRCSERTVRRILKRVQARLQRVLAESTLQHEAAERPDERCPAGGEP